MTTTPNSINVFARWRPLSEAEAASGEIDYSTLPASKGLSSAAIKDSTSVKDRSWASPRAFHTIFGPQDRNSDVYNAVVAPAISKVLLGETCNFFAYGHSGSGKTHTILSQGDNHNRDIGLCLTAADQLLAELHRIHETGGPDLGIGLSVFELRHKSAFDLLDKRTECYVKEGPDGHVYFRGKTKTREGGKVVCCSITQRPCWDFGSFQKALVEALGYRSTGSSSMHSQSSRTHLVLELAIVNKVLVDAREALAHHKSELVPVGKILDDFEMEDAKRRDAAENPDAAKDPDAAEDPGAAERRREAQKQKIILTARIREAEKVLHNVLKSIQPLNAKMVFIDLAGAEYCSDNTVPMVYQSVQERRESRQINTDLLALKEVMRAWSKGAKRIPFRSSTLTMVLRKSFLVTGSSNMLVTLSPAKDQYSATQNSLRYANIVGAPVADDAMKRPRGKEFWQQFVS